MFYIERYPRRHEAKQLVKMETSDIESGHRSLILTFEDGKKRYVSQHGWDDLEVGDYFTGLAVYVKKAIWERDYIKVEDL